MLVCDGASWTPLKSGEWGIRVRGAALRPCAGDRVLVTRRDGSTSIEEIAAVYWNQAGASGCDAVCSVVSSRPAPRSRGRGRRPAPTFAFVLPSERLGSVV